MSTWRTWCPICRAHRPSRIPAEADTRTVAAAYDRHLKTHRKSKEHND